MRRRRETRLAFAEPVRDRIAPIAAEAAARDLDARRRLPALVLGGVEQTLDAGDGLTREAPGHQAVHTLFALNETVQDRVELLVRRQRVLVGLVGPELRCRGFHDRRLG